MTTILVEEDGTGITDANTYCDQDFADEYHTLYGNSDWTGTDEDKETALVVACQTLDLLYYDKFKSSKYEAASLGQRQNLAWPRYQFYDQQGILRSQGEIPVELKRAQCELAVRYLNGEDMMPEPNVNNAVGAQMIKVGDIQTSTTYRYPLQNAMYEGFKKIDALLSPILRPKVTNIKLSR